MRTDDYPRRLERAHDAADDYPRRLERAHDAPWSPSTKTAQMVVQGAGLANGKFLKMWPPSSVAPLIHAGYDRTDASSSIKPPEVGRARLEPVVLLREAWSPARMDFARDSAESTSYHVV